MCRFIDICTGGRGEWCVLGGGRAKCPDDGPCEANKGSLCGVGEPLGAAAAEREGRKGVEEPLAPPATHVRLRVCVNMCQCSVRRQSASDAAAADPPPPTARLQRRAERPKQKRRYYKRPTGCSFPTSKYIRNCVIGIRLPDNLVWLIRSSGGGRPREEMTWPGQV